MAKEAGKGSKDARIDYNNLTPFFKELFEDIDTSNNGAISSGEMRAALRDDVLADRLSRVIAKHPSEWHVDASLTKWQYLNEVITDNDELEATKTQIKNMAWWDDALCSGADFPISPDVYHLHPISFLNIISSIKDTTYSEEFKLLVATIYGEAANSSEIAWKAITCVIMNRVGKREWSEYSSPIEIITKTGFDAYSHKTPLFTNALAYLNGKDSTANKKIIQDISK